MTPPLSQRLREAAETIEQLNAMSGLGLNYFVTPRYLRSEAERIEAEG